MRGGDSSAAAEQERRSCLQEESARNECGAYSTGVKEAPFLKQKGLSSERRGFGLSRTRPTRLGGCAWRIGALRGRQAGVVVVRVKEVGGWGWGWGKCVPVKLGLVLVRTFAAFGPWL